MPSSDTASTHWAIDKRVPLALIVTLAFHLLGSAWYIGKMANSIEDIERRVNSMEITSLSRDTQQNNLAIAVGRLQESTTMLRETVSDLRSAMRNNGGSH